MGGPRKSKLSGFNRGSNMGIKSTNGYLDPKVGRIMAQKPLKPAQKAIILHTFGVQVTAILKPTLVGFRVTA